MQDFLAMHHGERPLLLPNPWDVGSAVLFASLGFQALATTSSGHAATLGRLDGSVTRDEALAHAAEIVAATDVPVSADLENGFADDLGEIRELVSSVERPVNVLARPGAPSVDELAAAGVSRVSVGGAFAYAALGAAAEAGRELLESGTYGFWETAAGGAKAARAAFGS